MAKAKTRLDQLLVQRGLAETRSKAQALIMAGSVRVAGAVRTKPGELVPADAPLEVSGGLPYVSRGGYKLAHALDTFGLSPAGRVALDVGASTGGFTDVLLQRGAARVYAVDVGYGILDYRLRQDPRVVVLERTNIRYLEALPNAERRTLHAEGVPEGYAEQAGAGEPTSANTNRTAAAVGEDSSAFSLQPSAFADCAVIDVSFISLKLVLPAVQRLTTADAWVVALIKPQFEAGAGQVGKGGVVRDPAVHAAVLRDILGFARDRGMAPHGLTRSPITGPAGNVEFLAWLAGPGPQLDIEGAVRDALAAGGT